MPHYKVICPECSGEIVTRYPEIMLWELCPRCRLHVWDRYDVWMAEEYRFSDDTTHAGVCSQVNH